MNVGGLGKHFAHLGDLDDVEILSVSGPTNAELREDGGFELREDGGYELRE